MALLESTIRPIENEYAQCDYDPIGNILYPGLAGAHDYEDNLITLASAEDSKSANTLDLSPLLLKPKILEIMLIKKSFNLIFFLIKLALIEHFKFKIQYNFSL